MCVCRRGGGLRWRVATGERTAILSKYGCNIESLKTEFFFFDVLCLLHFWVILNSYRSIIICSAGRMIIIIQK